MSKADSSVILTKINNEEKGKKRKLEEIEDDISEETEIKINREKLKEF